MGLFNSIEKSVEGKIFLIDMDGTLCRWYQPKFIKSIWKFPPYYLFLKPEKNMLRLVKLMEKSGETLLILSSANSMLIRCMKLLWLKKYGINIPTIFVPYGTDKSSIFAKADGKRIILIDDYTYNCHDFVSNGFEAIKFRNSFNHVSGKWHGPVLDFTWSPETMKNFLNEF